MLTAPTCGFRAIGALVVPIGIIAAVASLAADICVVTWEQGHMPGQTQMYGSGNAGGIRRAIVAGDGFADSRPDGLRMEGELG